jgi:hypothetical protein
MNRRGIKTSLVISQNLPSVKFYLNGACREIIKKITYTIGTILTEVWLANLVALVRLPFSIGLVQQ